MGRRSRSRRGRLWAGVYVGLFGVPNDTDADADTDAGTDGTPADESDDAAPPEG